MVVLKTATVENYVKNPSCIKPNCNFCSIVQSTQSQRCDQRQAPVKAQNEDKLCNSLTWRLFWLPIQRHITIVGNIYRPNTAPFADIKKFNQTLSEILFILKNNSEFKNAQDIILLGDININLLNHTSHSDTGIYLDTLLENGLLPLVSLPT